MSLSNEPSAELPIESLRRLARGLLRERGESDDLVQEAWLAALRTRGEIRELGAWFAGTLRHLARNRSREERRRDHRERLAARPEAQPSALEASARIEILQRLLAAVDRLDPPYREAIVLRYFDDLPPRAIAERLGIPVNTARTHVRRGLERLRRELDPGPGREREALLATLLPLVGPRAGITGGASDSSAPPTTRTSVMQNPLWLATSALMLGTLAWFLVRPAAPGSRAGASDLALATEPPAARAATDPSQASAPAPRGEQPSPRRTPASAWTVRGHVRRVDLPGPYPAAPLVGRVFAGGRPAGAPLSEERFQANESGVFAWTPATPPEGLFTVEVAADLPGMRASARHAWFLPGDPPPEDWWIVLYALDTTLRGTVRGPDGEPLAGAWVGFELGDEEKGVQSAADGSFELLCTAALVRRTVCAWKAGLAPGLAEIAQPVLGSEHVHEITLEPELRLCGTVREPGGAPLAGAEVAVANQLVPPLRSAVRPDGEVAVRKTQGWVLDGAWPSTRTDASGRYEIAGIHPAAVGVVLRATARGHRPGEVSCPGVENRAERDWDFTLARSVTVTGRVHAAGRPIEAAWITVGDWVGEEGAPEAWCDAEGRFTLGEVAPGRQHLWVWRRGLAQLRHDVDVRAGMAALELELTTGHFVGGVVLGPDGAPMPAALLLAEDASGAEPPALSGHFARTGLDGRFRLDDLPACRVALTVSAQGCEYLTQEVALDRGDHVLRLAAETPDPATSGTSAPVVPVTAASGSASLHGRLLDLAGNGLAGEEVELAAAPAPGTADSGIWSRRDPEDAFLPATPAEAGSAPGAGPWRATTDALGEFRLTNLPAGTFDARWVRKEAGLTALDLETRVTLAADEARELDLQPRGRTTLRGTLEFLTELPANTVTAGYGRELVLGPPPGGMPKVAALGLRRVSDDRSAPLERRGAFAHDGRFELAGLGAGEWTFEPVLFMPGGRGASVTMTSVTLPEQGAADVRLGILYFE